MALGRQIGERRARKRAEATGERAIAGAPTTPIRKGIRGVPDERKMVI